MRKRKVENGITVNAIAGTYVIFFGLDLLEEYRKDFRGFAFKRHDHSDGEVIWLRGLKTFKDTEPNPAIGETFPTYKHPVQGFQWADYSVHPGFKYTYTIICMYGDPANLRPEREIQIDIETEKAISDTHSVFFNRGSVATQEYARRFMNKTPDKAGPGAYEWLSRGLIEALITFIDNAEEGDSIHGAIYEFQYPDVLLAIKNAVDNNKVKVHILYDDVERRDKNGKTLGPWENNRIAIAKAQINSICQGRNQGKLMHNKFLVLSKKDKPMEVWTGSTNITENGIFGHSNLGHIVKDEVVAQSFLDYWNRLNKDPEIDKIYRKANMSASPIPHELKNGTTAIFSPRETLLDSLKWYVDIALKARDALFMTFAFGMHEKFKAVYRKQDNVLRMALMEKAYSSPRVKKRDEKDIQTIRDLPNVLISIGNRIITNSFDRWLREMYSVDGRGKHVYWIHTKYMLVDPLGEEPIVITGSANFSEASTETNDENMLVIKGDKRTADIYFGEYMRLFSHYSFREAVKWALEKNKNKVLSHWRPQYLETKDTWMKDYFDPKDTTSRFMRRKYFSGQTN